MTFLSSLSGCMAFNDCRVAEYKAMPLNEKLLGGPFSKCYGPEISTRQKEQP